MLLWLLRNLLYLRTAIKSTDTPRMLAVSVAMGMVLGMVPKGNLLAVALVMVILAFRVNVAVAMVSALAFSLIGPLTDPLTHRLGHWVLTRPALWPHWAQLYELPLAPWTRFNNTVVMGSILLGAGLFYPSYRASLPVFERRAARTRGRTAGPEAATTQPVAVTTQEVATTHPAVATPRPDVPTTQPEAATTQPEVAVVVETARVPASQVVAPAPPARASAEADVAEQQLMAAGPAKQTLPTTLHDRSTPPAPPTPEPAPAPLLPVNGRPAVSGPPAVSSPPPASKAPLADKTSLANSAPPASNRPRAPSGSPLVRVDAPHSGSSSGGVESRSAAFQRLRAKSFDVLQVAGRWRTESPPATPPLSTPAHDEPAGRERPVQEN